MSDDRRIILVTGAARSGKSQWAETLAGRSGKPVIYIATSRLDSNDPEWLDRVREHRQRRPPRWTTLEIPLELSASIETAESPSCLLIDSLGTWVANGLEMDGKEWGDRVTDFLASLQRSAADILLVAEETGWGVVPAYPIGRLFRDRLGSLTRRVGSIADTVYLVTGGHALDLTKLGQRLED
ncbi:bifunctional adenosylcobinamide kinase/adenosylcobinamide-phosphate guanylyltransferase [Pannus brasiliensis CCIBt3594]|uniref:Adenosylcobinamide kinase n=1 Tax=Pannus brasiliensis CCIBt3594 TaxID=1427578 RepID=A0AAW9QQ42_9CHRO